VKRLWTAIGLSVLLHSLFLSSDFRLSARQEAKMELPRHLTVTLSYRQPPPTPPETPRKPPPAPIRKPEAPPKIVKLTPAKTPEVQSKKPEPEIQPIEPPAVEPEPHTETSEVEAPDPPSRTVSEKVPEETPIASEPQARTHALPAPPAPVTLREAHPAYRKNPPPPYPGAAKRRGIEGVVLLDVFVNAAGKVEKAAVYQSSGYAILDRTALKAVGVWIFEPGMMGDRPVAMWVRVPIRFELK